VAVLGFVVIVVGIILLVFPGPGWLTIFLGLGIWATEFSWARNVLKFVRRQVGIWTKWVGRQPRWVSLSIGAAGLILVGVVIWIVST
jgi:uncharacterized protein (TIGR02611 family)